MRNLHAFKNDIDLMGLNNFPDMVMTSDNNDTDRTE